MNKSIEPYQLLVLWQDKVISAVNFQNRTVVRDDDGTIILDTPTAPVDLPPGLTKEVLGAVNAGALARIAELEGAARSMEEKDAQIAALKQQVIDLTPAGSDLLGDLNAGFEQGIPAGARAAFAVPYAIVRVLVQAGQLDLANAVINEVQVPPELEDVKAGLIAVLASA
jgi:hypothetical protein